MAREHRGCRIIHLCMATCFIRKNGCTWFMEIFSYVTTNRTFLSEAAAVMKNLTHPICGCLWVSETLGKKVCFILAPCFLLTRSRWENPVTRFCFKQARPTMENL